MKDIETGELDYDAMLETAKKEKPKIVLAGYSAYPREVDYAKMKAIAEEVGAYAVMDMAHVAGLIAGGAHKNPFDYGFDVVTTTTHKTLRGPRGGMILSRNEEFGKKIDKSVFPGFPGRPHHADDCGQGGGLRRSTAARIQGVRRADHQKLSAPSRVPDGSRRQAHHEWNR